MKLAQRLKKKSLKSSDKSAGAGGASGLAMWEAQLAEQGGQVMGGSSGSPSSSPSSPVRAVVNGTTRRTTLSSSDPDSSSSSSSSSPLAKSSSPAPMPRTNSKLSCSNPGFGDSAGGESGEEYTTIDRRASCTTAADSSIAGSPSGPQPVSPRRLKPATQTTPTRTGGLLGRFGRNKNNGASSSALQKSAAAEEDSRRQAQMAALEMFREKGTSYNYAVPAAYSTDDAQATAEDEMANLRLREQERRVGRGKRSNDVLIEIVEGRPQLRAGTFEEIMKWIIFNNVNEHVSSFLITFRAYGTPADLWAALMRVFQIIEEKDKMASIMKADLRKKTLDLLVEWIRRFSYKDFTENGDKTLFKKLTKFIKSLPAEEANQFKLLFMRKRDDAAVTKAKEAESADSSRSGSVCSASDSGRFDRDLSSADVPLSHQSSPSFTLSSSDFVPIVAPQQPSTALSSGSRPSAVMVAPPGLTSAPAGSLHAHAPRTIAQQMTFLDAATFAEIQPEEMLLSNWTRANKEEVAPTLTNLARQFNMWSGMVATDIILANSLVDQVALVKHYIRVLHHLYRLNNFQSLMAVMSGLNCSSVSRLKRVWSKIPAKYTELFAGMEQVMSPLGNFKYYRQILAENRDKQPIVPYLVVFLRDLTFINDGNCETLMSEPASPLDVPRELPNFEKMVLLGQQILELEAYRKVPYDIEENPSVTSMLKNARYMDEDSLHRRSIEQEPIHSLNDGGENEDGPSEVVVKNPLVALKAISKDFKAVSASEENDLSGDQSLTLSEVDELSATL